MAMVPMSVSGTSGSMINRIAESAKGSGEMIPVKKAAETVVEMQNKDNFAMKTGIDNQKFEDAKGVKEVDVKV